MYHRLLKRPSQRGFIGRQKSRSIEGKYLAREFDRAEDIVAWADSLDERWPERVEVRKQMVDVLESLSCSQPVIFELCSGDGRLARQILQSVPDAHYVGVDASVSLCRYVEETAGIDAVEADLSRPGWSDKLERPVDAIITLQSMHDVGDGDTIQQIYDYCHELLAPSGVFLVADFVVPEDGFDPEKPGRLPKSWHSAALSRSGFDSVTCLLHSGSIGCFKGVG